MTRWHFLRLAFAVGAATTAWRLSWLAAQSAAATVSRSGIVVAVDGDDIQVETPAGRLTVQTNPATRIWRGEDGMSVSVIRAGDEISAKGISASSGMLLASEIWASITQLDGIIRQVSGDDVEIDVVRNDLVPEVKIVRLSDKTIGSDTLLLKRADIEVGRAVMVIGLALEDGTLKAYRFVVYVNGRAVDSTATKYRDPHTGEIIDKL